MQLRLVISLLLFSLISAELPPPASYQSAVGKCLTELRKSFPVNQSLDYFVGTGWDNLRNVQTRTVLHRTFDKCLTTPDGLYLIPDNVIAINIQETEFDQMATFYESFSSYFNSISDTVNRGGGFGFAKYVGISGSYSEQHQQTKMEMATISSNLFVTKMKARSYSLVASPETGLDPEFKRRLMEIVDHMRNNMTLRAIYEAQLIVLDYGTHYVSRADIGINTEQMNYLSRSFNYTSQQSLDSMKAATAASFHAWLFGADYSSGTGKTVTTQMKSQLSDYTRHVRINTKGGPTAQKISACQVNDKKTCIGDIDNLAAIDQDGEPLYTLITTYFLDELRPIEVDQLAGLLIAAITEYYQRNAIPGCTDPKDQNYNSMANVNDGTCNGTGPPPPSFGGVYQICDPIDTAPQYRCDQFAQKNGMSGTYACASPYVPKLVTDYIFDGFEDRVVDQETRDCHHHVVYKTCHTNVQHIVYKDKVRLRSYSCVPPTSSAINPSYLFGGLYSPGQPNLWTNGESCPPYYSPAKIAGDVNLCLSRDGELGGQYQVPLNGIYSCQTPVEQQKCPDGYSSHLATITPTQCEVYYCIQTGIFKHFDLPQIKRPPFLPPSIKMSNISEHYVRYFQNDELIIAYPLNVVLDESLQNETENSRFLVTASQDDVNALVAGWITQKLIECGVPNNMESVTTTAAPETTSATRNSTVSSTSTSTQTSSTLTTPRPGPGNARPSISSARSFWSTSFALYVAFIVY